MPELPATSIPALHRLEIAYLGIETTESGPLANFHSAILGLAPAEPPADFAAAWRLDTAPFRLLVNTGGRDDAVLLGIEAADADVYAEVVVALGTIGVAVTAGTDTAAADRQVERLCSFRAPWGLDVELVLGFDRSPEAPTDLVPGGYLTDDVGFGHTVFQIAADDFDAARAFVEDGLGMRRSDSLEANVNGTDMIGIFYHCNPRHHSLALGRFPGRPPQTLHHVMIETAQIDGVGATYERVLAAGVPVAAGLGRHDNDEMFSFYCVSPAGYQVEVGWGARTVTEDWNPDGIYDRASVWGHVPHAAPSAALTAGAAQ